MRSRSDGAALTREYLDALKHQRRLSAATLRNYTHAIGLLLKETTALEALEPAQARRYIAMLHAKGASPRTLALTLSAWRGLYRWLARHRGFAANPVLGIRAPRAGRPLPKALSVEAAQRLLDGDFEKSPLNLQDAAMFELLYSSGLRVAELAALDLSDEPWQGEVTVTGKGSKTRTVPVGAKARAALEQWLSARRQVCPTGDKALFVGARGRRITPSRVWQRLGAWARRRGLAEHVHPHMLRHATGYKLANDGHDTRAIQQYLGHRNITHSVRYTELSPDRFNSFWQD